MDSRKLQPGRERSLQWVFTHCILWPMSTTGNRSFGTGPALIAAVAMLLLGAALGFAVDIDGIIDQGEYPGELSLADGDFLLYWSVDRDTAYFGIQARASGWVSIGFDPVQAMDQADMIFGWVAEDGTAGALDTFSTGLFGPHPPDEELGGRDDILAFAGSEDDGLTVFEFSRLLDTGDPYDKPLSLEGEIDVIWAYSDSDDYRSFHGHRGHVILSLAAGEAAEIPAAGSGLDLYRLLYPVHAILMGVSFVLLFVGMFLPRYFKGKKWWLKTHRRIGIAGGVIGVVGVGIAVYMISRSTRIHLRVVHSYLGLATILLMIYMPLLGHFMLRIRGNPARAKRARAVHRWVGRLTLALMAATIVLGLFQAGIL